MTNYEKQKKFLFLFLETFGHFGHDLEQITDKTEIGNLEDGRLGVLVNSRNRLAVLHTFIF